ncbi:MAG: cytochrome C biogenesis protein [Epsilonproteobacteria bacterium]|nr:cytochrome C biogenesis protein [Campylobacterota bacterium]NPA64596.1 TlpA family protein disulfide reductase [Campylobacterota bacterium]
MKKLALLLVALSLFGMDRGLMSKLGIQEKGVYVIDFFASWCHSCQKELPLLNAMDSVQIIGVDVDENMDDGKAFVKKLGLKFKVIYDPKGEIVSKFDPPGIPALYIIKDGEVVHSIIGARPHIDKDLAKILKELR